jgi:hypothetical protein
LLGSGGKKESAPGEPNSSCSPISAIWLKRSHTAPLSGLITKIDPALAGKWRTEL